MRVLVAGSHGMIGSALVDALKLRGDEVSRLVRHAQPKADEVGWDPRPNSATVDVNGLEGFDAIVSLGGVSIGEKRWTQRQKQRLWDSRVASTEILTKALLQLELPPKTFISASGVGYYGNRGEEELTETSSPGTGFLAELCKTWESVTVPATAAGARVVNIRSGIVLAAGKGVLKEQTPLFKLGVGGPLGSGEQWISWISLEGEVRAILHILDNESLSGAVNTVSPFAVRNVQYTIALAKVLNRPAIIPAPRWMIALALGGELADELLLASQNAVPEKLQASGFRFQDDDLEATFRRIFKSAHRTPPDDEPPSSNGRGPRFRRK